MGPKKKPKWYEPNPDGPYVSTQDWDEADYWLNDALMRSLGEDFSYATFRANLTAEEMAAYDSSDDDDDEETEGEQQAEEETEQEELEDEQEAEQEELEDEQEVEQEELEDEQEAEQEELEDEQEAEQQQEEVEEERTEEEEEKSEHLEEREEEEEEEAKEEEQPAESGEGNRKGETVELVNAQAAPDGSEPAPSGVKENSDPGKGTSSEPTDQPGAGNVPRPVEIFRLANRIEMLICEREACEERRADMQRLRHIVQLYKSNECSPPATYNNLDRLLRQLNSEA